MRCPPLRPWAPRSGPSAWRMHLRGRPGARRPSCRLSVRGEAAASTTGERQQQTTVAPRSASSSSAAARTRRRRRSARAPCEAAPPFFRRPEEPRRGCVRFRPRDRRGCACTPSRRPKWRSLSLLAPEILALPSLEP